MASLRVHPDRLEIHLTAAEKTLAFRREDLVIQRENIRSVTITDDPWIWVRGIRAPGALVPLVVAVGVWKFHGGKDFLAIKRRRQAVVIDLIGDDFARVILSTNHAPDLIASLKLEATDAQDVPELDEPTAAEQPAEPTSPVKPAKPAKRIRTPKVAKAVELTEPAVSAAPVKPARRARPATVATVVEPAETTETIKPAKRASRAKVTPLAESAADPVDLPVAEPVDVPEATA
ncbi:hypothetical protein [Cryobacterium adonitolivorans]|uniref:hypothetical protein n=1 Tax=Cryobacterium adonitolivorans TaxID=1259189 RepID=UPI0015822C28|nr:hypothetical protein [Cryobacterium adonitolivorans]